MPDQFSDVSSQSWLGRIGNSFKGILVGLIFLPLSVALLYWNESRAVTTSRSLKEGAAAVVSIDSKEVSPANDKKLVQLSGDVTTTDVVSDPEFGVSGNGIRLERKVETYQWKENEHSETKKNLGGGTETVTTYTYEKTWSNRHIDSSEFKHPEGHANPTSQTAQDHTALASHVTVGAFKVTPELIAKMKGDEPLVPGDGDLAKLSPNVKGKAKVSGEGFYLGADPAAPAVGDEKVTFKILKPATFSILAQQVGDSFAAYPTKAGHPIERVESGIVSAAEMFQHAESENAILTWILRVVGFVIMSFGFGMIVAPFSVFGDVIPLIGNIIGAGATFGAIVLGFIGSVITIAVAWIVVRPILGCALIALAIAAFVLGHRRGRGNRGPAGAPVAAS